MIPFLVDYKYIKLLSMFVKILLFMLSGVPL